jgi:hypothetical protein
MMPSGGSRPDSDQLLRTRTRFVGVRIDDYVVDCRGGTEYGYNPRFCKEYGYSVIPTIREIYCCMR